MISVWTESRVAAAEERGQFIDPEEERNRNIHRCKSLPEAGEDSAHGEDEARAPLNCRVSERAKKTIITTNKNLL
jgi:hypothetical protein